MKTLDQIYRYTSECRFPDKDWQEVLAYCRSQFGGGKIYKSKNPIANSTYQEFLNWISDGFGAGDMVSYGNTMGIVGTSTPAGVTLVAYCDFEGNLIVNDMPVLNVERLQPLDKERKAQFQRLMFENGVGFYVRLAKIGELYTPKKYFYVSFDDGYHSEPCVGMYLESNNSKHHFAAYLCGKTLQMDCWIDTTYTPLQSASEADIQRLHSVASKKGWSYNERCHKFIKSPKRGQNNVYWYLNDRFELVMDRDNGTKKHTERLEAGNYILDYTEGLMFMKEVRKMRGKA